MRFTRAGVAQATEERRKALASGGGEEELSFDPVTITFVDLKYFVPNPHKGESEPLELQLLQSITGTIRPGMHCCVCRLLLQRLIKPLCCSDNKPKQTFRFF